MIHRPLALAGAALAVAIPLAFGSTAASAQAKSEIRIAHVYSKSGPLEAYGKQTQTGLMMGLDYATGGTMTVNGKKLVVIEKDDQGKPDVGKSLLATAYGDDKADIAVGPSSSGVALALVRYSRGAALLAVTRSCSVGENTHRPYTSTMRLRP